MFLEIPGVSLGYDPFGAFIQHNYPVGDGEDGLQLMGDHHHGGPQAGIDALDQNVQLYRSDGV
jgi:hypothetical protein